MSLIVRAYSQFNRHSEATIATLKERLPDWLATITGKETIVRGDRFAAFCPLCEHHKPKLEGIRSGTWVATCRVCGKGGDLPKLAGLYYGCNFPEAITRAARALELSVDLESCQRRPTPELGEKDDAAEKRSKWPKFEESPERGVRTLAKLRGIPWEGIRAAHDWGILRFGYRRDKHGDRASWVLRSHDGLCAEARPMDGRPFVTTGGNHKALAFPGSEKKHALLGEHLLSASLDPVFVTEGGPDFLAACWLAYAATTIVGAPSWKPVGFLGSNCDFTEEQVSKLSNRLVRIFVHADKAGHEAAEKWKGRLKDAGCRVQLAYVERICEEMPNGKPVEDLNDALIANEKSLEQFTREVIAL